MLYIKWNTMIEIIRIATLIGISLKMFFYTLYWLSCSESHTSWEDTHADDDFRYVKIMLPVFLITMITEHIFAFNLLSIIVLNGVEIVSYFFILGGHPKMWFQPLMIIQNILYVLIFITVFPYFSVKYITKNKESPINLRHLMYEYDLLLCKHNI